MKYNLVGVRVDLFRERNHLLRDIDSNRRLKMPEETTCQPTDSASEIQHARLVFKSVAFHKLLDFRINQLLSSLEKLAVVPSSTLRLRVRQYRIERIFFRELLPKVFVVLMRRIHIGQRRKCDLIESTKLHPVNVFKPPAFNKEP